MHKKIQYRATDVHHVTVDGLLEVLEATRPVVVGVDVAKRKFLAALGDGRSDARQIVRFAHPGQTHAFVQLLAGLQAAGRDVQVVMEPTGTYGDALRYQLGTRSIPVYRVNNKHVHDAAELFDRSASKHDAKDASLIGWLHAQQRSALWQELSEQRRTMRALISERELFEVPLRRLITQMEPLLARHFPELEQLFDLSRRKTPYQLLAHFGSPQGLARAGAEPVTEVLRQAARRRPGADTVQALLQAARHTAGVVAVDAEVQLIRTMSREILRLMERQKEIDKRIEQVGSQVPCVHAMRPCLGPVTAAVVYAYAGDPGDYQSAHALEKAIGLNLIERSSGTDPGSRHLSKRGPALVRKYLFLAAMRLIHTDPTVQAWYQDRRSFKAGDKIKALIAVERKLCRALHHVAQGQRFQAGKLFDTRRLHVTSDSKEVAA